MFLCEKVFLSPAYSILHYAERGGLIFFYVRSEVAKLSLQITLSVRLIARGNTCIYVSLILQFPVRLSLISFTIWI